MRIFFIEFAACDAHLIVPLTDKKLVEVEDLP
jgi:hypothetical protein